MRNWSCCIDRSGGNMAKKSHDVLFLKIEGDKGDEGDEGEQGNEEWLDYYPAGIEYECVISITVMWLEEDIVGGRVNNSKTFWGRDAEEQAEKYLLDLWKEEIIIDTVGIVDGYYFKRVDD
jgi:hypothetical protein